MIRVVAIHEVIDTMAPIRRLLDIAYDRKIVDTSLFHFGETPEHVLDGNADNVKGVYGLSNIKRAYHVMRDFVGIRFKGRTHSETSTTSA